MKDRSQRNWESIGCRILGLMIIGFGLSLSHVMVPARQPAHDSNPVVWLLIVSGVVCFGISFLFRLWPDE